MRKGKRKLNKRTAAVIAAAVFSLIVIVIIRAIDSRIEPRVKEICSNYCKMHLDEIMSGAVMKVIEENEISYNDIVIRNEKNGSLNSLEIRTEKVNLLQTQVIKKIMSKIQNDYTELVIPLGSVSDSFFLSGRGPDIKVRLMLSGGVDTDIVESFKSAGINQTCHTISMVLSANATIIMPTGSMEISTKLTCPIAESVIIGEVPKGFLNRY